MRGWVYFGQVLKPISMKLALSITADGIYGDTIQFFGINEPAQFCLHKNVPTYKCSELEIVRDQVNISLENSSSLFLLLPISSKGDGAV